MQKMIELYPDTTLVMYLNKISGKIYCDSPQPEKAPYFAGNTVLF